MTRHIILTALIVAVVYMAILWVNEDLFSEERATWEDYQHYVQSDKAISSQEAESNEAATETYSEPVRSVSNTPEKPADSPADNYIQEFVVTGLVTAIDLSDAGTTKQQVESAWQQFSQHDELQAAVSWVKGSNTAYAYFYDFNESFTQAKLMVGYNVETSASGLRAINVQAGEYTLYTHNSDGSLPDSAWEKAYPNGCILERHTLTIYGQVSHSDALVIQ